MKRKVVIAIFLSSMLTVAMLIPGFAQSTTKSLSTNFTLINLGSGPATGLVEYLLPNGDPWGDGSESFTISDPGGQAIFRQYFDPGEPGNPNLTEGSGSAVVSSDQPLGAVVQIQARGQDPTSNGAYSGFSSGSGSFYVPLVTRNLFTASGTGNSQIVVQNTGSSAVDLEIEMVNANATSRYIEPVSGLQPGASFYYDLALESASNVPDNWYGSAVVRTTTAGSVAVVSNFFTGDAMQTFNAFEDTAPTTDWYVPLFTSRLSNSLSTVIAVQNLSGGAIAVGDVDMTCTPDASLGGSGFVASNTSEIGDTAAYYFNPVTDMTMPAGFYGSCVVESTADIVAFVQMRFIDTGEAAAYSAIPGGGTDTTVLVPLVAKRLSNGFATNVTIQNTSGNTATVDLSYIPSSEYGGSPATIEINDVEIGPYLSYLQNHRITDGVPELPEEWFGSLVVTSDEPIDSFVQLSFVTFVNPSLPDGDNFMAHNAFTQP
jgi:hypothetical protein